MTFQTISCSCGLEFSGDGEELYSLVRGHIDRLHPERHHPMPLSGVERSRVGAADPCRAARVAPAAQGPHPALATGAA